MSSWLLSELVVVCGFLFAALAIAHMLRQRRSPQSAVAWLISMLVVPYIAVPFYVLFGGRKSRRIAVSKSYVLLSDTEGPPADDAAAIDRMLRSYDIPGATGTNGVTLCPTGEDAYRALADLIEGASTSLCITMFILRRDEVGRDIVERLARRAREGVEVRLLLDGLGSLFATRRFLTPLTDAGGHVAHFLPMLRFPLRGRANLRNHRKIVVADASRALSGGINIATEYIGPTPQRGRWRDLAFVLEGPAVQHFAEVFHSDWAFATGERLETRPPDLNDAPGGGAVVQVVPSGPDVQGDPIYAAILSAVYAARERVWVVTPYFIPDDALLQALCLAARRGIDVRILVPRKSNHPVADIARGTYLREIQAAGGRVLLYGLGMLHAKVMVTDDELAMIGSANMDMRSLFLNYEVAMFVYSRPEIDEAARWIEQAAASAHVGVPDVGSLRDLGESCVRMIAPLL